jgi:5-methyltetrahydropteroyltriglutamate--homocysteine methyltransferase
MKLSTDRILTTHVGSLPRPPRLLELLRARSDGRDYDRGAFDALVATTVEDLVAQQVACGIDVVDDGEASKLSYTFYVKGRLAGIGDDPQAATRSREIMAGADMQEHPDFAERQARPFDLAIVPACIGPVSYGDGKLLEQDLANLRHAVDRASPRDAFVTCASPGVLTKFVIDTYYEDEDAYVEALAEALKAEYEAVHRAGFVLQIDCPDLASARHNQYRALSDDAFLRIAARNIEALNYATAEIPPEAMRMHLCWGNYEGPHTHDIALAKLADLCFRARPSGISFEGANPRHAHEWEDLAALKIPDDKILIPGVIDSTTNFVEHPRLIAQRIKQYADIVGRERVIAGADCGFATFAADHPTVATSIVWAKFRALAEGARIASKELWR